MAAKSRYDVAGIGNAIVDVIASVDEAFLVKEKLTKGAMRLVDAAAADTLYGSLGPATEISGGSAANTIAGLASFGAKTAFVGKVGDDALGGIFSHDVQALGVSFETKPLRGGATGRCLVMVTPDGERTMNTFLGAGQELSPSDLDEQLVRDSAILYLEGYLWDPPAAKETFLKGAEIARKAGREVALSLSDSFCVDRYRGEFLDLMRSGKVTIVFANQSELHSLYETSDTETGLALLARDVPTAIVTRSEKGAVVLQKAARAHVPAFPVGKIVDLTGAGDLFAAGTLFGMARGMNPDRSARLGALAAAEVITHYGARPQVNLAEHAAQHGLL